MLQWEKRLEQYRKKFKKGGKKRSSELKKAPLSKKSSFNEKNEMSYFV